MPDHVGVRAVGDGGGDASEDGVAATTYVGRAKGEIVAIGGWVGTLVADTKRLGPGPLLVHAEAPNTVSTMKTPNARRSRTVDRPSPAAYESTTHASVETVHPPSAGPAALILRLMGGTWIRSPKAAAVGIALLLFAIVLAMESTGAGIVVLGLAVVGLLLVIFA